MKAEIALLGATEGIEDQIKPKAASYAKKFENFNEIPLKF